MPESLRCAAQAASDNSAAADIRAAAMSVLEVSTCFLADVRYGFLPCLATYRECTISEMLFLASLFRSFSHGTGCRSHQKYGHSGSADYALGIAPHYHSPDATTSMGTEHN
jgi:hypothetical protein